MKRVSGLAKQAIAIVALATMAAAVPSGALNAQTIIEDWASVTAPPAPALKAVKLDPKTSALLVLDLVKQTCNNERRPRCVASVPRFAKLLEGARAQNMMVVHSSVPNAKPEDVLQEFTPKAGEPSVISIANKFVNTELEKMLKDKGITTVVVVGTAAHGAVVYTGSDAAMRGFNVVVPVDGLSGANTYEEQVATWLLASAPTVGQKVTLTKSDMITY